MLVVRSPRLALTLPAGSYLDLRRGQADVHLRTILDYHSLGHSDSGLLAAFAGRRKH